MIKYKSVTLGDATRDRYGNTYLVGSFSEDGFTLGSYSFDTPVGGTGAFIAKFDKNNSVLWAISPTVGYRAFARQVEIDNDGNIIVAGDFDTSISFGCLSFQGSGRSDIFLVKLLRNGTPVWITGTTGVDDSNVEKITMAPGGNCILIGNFVERSSVTPDLTAPDVRMGEIPVITGSANQIFGGYDSFVASVRPNGTVAWTQGIGGDGNNYDYVNDVTTDSQDNVLVTGYFNSDHISFDGQLVHSFQVSENFYLAKINSEGETQWVKETEGAINQSGWGVDTDVNDNIFVTGRYYGDAQFGAFSLPGKGEGDIFLAKLTAQGVYVGAKGIGGDGFDAGTALHVTKAGKVTVASYYYSPELDVGPFHSTMAEFTGADSFIATMTSDLETIECVRFITGEGESIVWNFDLDRFDNIIAVADLGVWGGDVIIGDQIINEPEYWSTIGILGNNPPTDEGEIEPPFQPVVKLGSDTTLCPGQSLLLNVLPLCDAQYQWSTGQSGTSITITAPGTYWVELTQNGLTIRDEIAVAYMDQVHADLGEDRQMCPNEHIVLTVPPNSNAEFRWDDGGTSNQRILNSPGDFWLEISTRCGTARDEISVNIRPTPSPELGDDIVSCDREITLSFEPKPEETIHWSDGSQSPSLTVTESGTYKVTVGNGCVEVTDAVDITINRPEEMEIPNVVTGNDDGKNDHFVLPAAAGKTNVLILNRWGRSIYESANYANDWPGTEIAAGTYFYVVRGDCLPEQKGVIHLMK